MTVDDIINRTIAIILFSAVSAESMATNWPKTESEFALLPPYCKAKMGPGNGLKVPEAEIQKWKQALGPGFMHVHHFCAGLNSLNSTSVAALRVVLKEFEYSQKHSPKDFPLQPKISVEKGKLLLRLNRSAEAVSEFQHAIMLKPNYAPAYAALSDYYAQYDQLIDKAKKTLEEGLKHSPNSKMLKRRLAKLQ